MPGTIIEISKINVTENRAIAIAAIKNSILGIRDILVLGGTIPGWDRTITGTEEPTRIMYKSLQTGTEWIAISNITWTNGNMTYAKLMYSTNSVDGTAGSGSWSNLANSDGKYICTFAYDGNGDLSTTTWS